jgi:hypothetical protein
VSAKRFWGRRRGRFDQKGASVTRLEKTSRRSGARMGVRRPTTAASEL